MGLLDGFLPEDTEVRQGLGSSLGALGLALASSPNNAPFQNLPQAFAIMGQQQKAGTSKAALKALLMQAGYSDAEAEKLSSSEGVAKLAIQQKQQQSILGSGGDAEPPLPGMGGSSATPAMSPPAPAGPAAGVSLNGGAPPLSGSGAEIQSKFVDALKSGGLTNPNGLAAVAAYGQHESRYDPGNISRTWSDPSESGQAGTSGGLLSWRGDRLANMQKATAGAADPVGAQAQFLLNENPALTQKLQNAKTPEEANALMAEAWKFAGYNRPGSGGEFDQRLATTRSYANRFLGQGQSPTQVAGMNPAISMPNGRPQVASDEQQTQALEGQMGMYPPSVYGVTPETQGRTATAQANAADLPSPDAQEAGFVIPPGAVSAVEKRVGTPPAPVNESIGPSTQRAQALANFNYWGKRLRASAALGDAGTGLAEEAKIKMGLAQKYLEPTEFDKLSEKAGLDGEELRAAARAAIPGNAPTSTQKEYASYRQQEISSGRQPLSQFDYDVALSKAKANSVTVGGAEKTYDADQGKTYSGLMTEFQAAGRKAPSTIATLNEAERLMNTPGFTAGIGTERFVLPFKQVAAKLGGDPNAPAAMETVRALANKAVTDQLGGSLGAGVSNADVSFLQKQNASLDNSVEANKALIGYAKKLAERQREIAAMARDYAKNNGGRLDVGFESKLADFAAANPLFPEAADRAPAAQGSNGGAPRAGAPAPGPTAAEMNATERALSVRRAKEAIQANPRARDAILRRMRDAGLPTDGF